MADGMNDVRAIRLAEIIDDFRTLQQYISQIDAEPSPEEYDDEGYVVLRQCLEDGRAVLSAPFSPSGTPEGDVELEKAHLQHVILDASARRFLAQRIYLKATAAMRCINTRDSVLQGQRPTSAHEQTLRQIDESLQNELETFTDEKVFAHLVDADEAQGRWLDEDPSLSDVLSWSVTL